MPEIVAGGAPGQDIYGAEGFLSPVRVMAEADAARLASKIAGIYAEHGAAAKGLLGSNAHFIFPELFDLVCSPAVLDHVEAVLGPDILCWSASFFSKPAADSSYVSWHQDLTYWGLEPADIVTAWIAVTPSTRESGCMRVVPGSHGQGQLSHSDTFAAANLLSRGQVLDVDVDENEAVDLVLQPGEMSLHHVLIVHGSEANGSALPRHGFAIRYIPTYCKQIGGRTTALLVRGEDRYNHFDPVPRPRADLHPDSLAFREKANGAVKAILMAGANPTIEPEGE
ncbi:MAG: phytanoyl-CoA dioxygenase family protein [Alphaproteobacteria bacterium]|jgi:ectoine hydroxylase-related dioxygenase (phytanoyl-CoA dioxygenase family)|nr:phytanoyl-CoA dioxygenase family protein [Alphaproteobacteria bacterium]